MIASVFAATLGRLGRHVQLLIDDAGADRHQRDGERDHLQVLRLAQHAQRFAAAHALLFAGALQTALSSTDPARRVIATTRPRTTPSATALDEHELPAADFLGEERGDARSERAAGGRAAADESEEPLRGARVVNQVGQRPELADEQHAVDLAEQIERDVNPVLARGEHDPEDHQQADHPRLRDGDHPASRQQAAQPAVALHDDPDDEGGDEQDVGNVVGAERRDEARPRNRLHDVVRRHREERVAEHHERRDGFLAPQLDDRRQQSLQQRHDRSLGGPQNRAEVAE